MNARNFIITLSLMVVSLNPGACMLNPDWKLTHAVDQFRDGSESSTADIASALIESATVDELDIPGLRSNGNVLYTMDTAEMTIQYPDRNTFTLTEGGEIKHLDRSSDYTVISDEIQMAVFNSDGSHRQDETAGDAKNPISSLVIAGDSVLYYKNNSIYNYNIIHHVSETKDYTVHMTVKHDKLIVIVGIAGLYYGSLINLENQSVIIKNISMASSHYHLGTNALYYMGGNTGNWQLICLALNTKSKKTIDRFSDITDIHLAAGGYVMENNAGLWAASYGAPAIHIPFTYELSGVYRDRVILTYRGASHIIDMKKFITDLTSMKQTIPALFVQNKGINKSLQKK
jgi:hypothetical protein